jgi:hypothetical protein
MRLHFKCVLVVIETTTKATISIRWNVSQKIKSWVLEYLPLFLSFFCPPFVLVCLVFFFEFLISPYSYFFLISSLVFYRLTSFFSVTLTLPLRLRDFRFPSFFSLSQNYSVHLCHRILSASFSTPPVYNMIFPRNS